MSMGDFRYKGLVIGGAILAFCASIGVLALSPWLILALVGAAGTGFFDSWQATPRNGVIQMITPDELRGRVSSFQHMLSGGTPAFGQALMGGVAALVGAPVGASVAAVAGAATCAVVICAIFAARPDLRARDLGEQHAPAALRVAEAQSLTG
jgi:hypothetical protein